MWRLHACSLKRNSNPHRKHLCSIFSKSDGKHNTQIHAWKCTYIVWVHICCWAGFFWVSLPRFEDRSVLDGMMRCVSAYSACCCCCLSEIQISWALCVVCLRMATKRTRDESWRRRSSALCTPCMPRLNNLMRRTRGRESMCDLSVHGDCTREEIPLHCVWFTSTFSNIYSWQTYLYIGAHTYRTHRYNR